MAKETVQGRTVACLLGPGFEDSEFKVPYDKLKAAGFEVVIIGAKNGDLLKGDKGYESATVELAIDDAKIDDYIALLVPGGHSPDKLRADDRFVRFVREFEATKRPLAMVCHGPQLLLTAGLAKGRTLTAWKTVQGDLKYAGANVVDREVVVDDNLITSRKPDDLEAFTAKLLEEIRELEERGGKAQSQLRTPERDVKSNGNEPENLPPSKGLY